MRYSRCKCGKRECWHSGEVMHPCAGCKDCGTSLAEHPDDHVPVEPHEWGEEQVEGSAANPTRFRVCQRCHKHEKLPASARPVVERQGVDP